MPEHFSRILSDEAPAPSCAPGQSFPPTHLGPIANTFVGVPEVACSHHFAQKEASTPLIRLGKHLFLRHIEYFAKDPH